MSRPTWGELVRSTAATLARGGGDPEGGDVVGGDRGQLEARWIIQHLSGFDAVELSAAGSEPATHRAVAMADGLVQRRAGGEPLQYVLGVWAFRDLDLLVDRRVLIPRPETEVLAEVAIATAGELGARRGRPDPWAAGATTYVVADLGTGSGALALALAGALPDAEVWATDASDDALAVARANFSGAGLPATRIRAASGSWFDALPEARRAGFRLIVTNPPYVSESEWDGLPDVVSQWEPRQALVSGPTGREAIDHVIGHADDWLEPGGALVVEMAPHQIARSVELAETSGLCDVEVVRDLASRERVMVARRTR